MKLAMYILSIFSEQPMVVLSWGVCKFGAIPDDRGIIFHVQGYKFNGWVKVINEKGDDLFKVIFLSNESKTVEEKKDIHLDELVNTIDEYVEKTDDYDERIKEQYRIVVLNQV